MLKLSWKTEIAEVPYLQDYDAKVFITKKVKK